MNNNFPKINNLGNMMGMPQMLNQMNRMPTHRMPAHGMPAHGMPAHRMPMNGMPMNGMQMNGLQKKGLLSLKNQEKDLDEMNNPNINGDQYYEPMKGRFYDTDSNLNYVNVHNPMSNKLESGEMIKSYIHDSRNFWLESYWKKLYYYVIVEKGKARLVKNKEEYKKQKKNVYSNLNTKTEYLRENFLTKIVLKKIIKKAINKVIYTDNYNYENTVRHYIYHHIKKNIIEKIKKNM